MIFNILIFQKSKHVKTHGRKARESKGEHKKAYDSPVAEKSSLQSFFVKK